MFRCCSGSLGSCSSWWQFLSWEGVGGLLLADVSRVGRRAPGLVRPAWYPGRMACMAPVKMLVGDLPSRDGFPRPVKTFDEARWGPGGWEVMNLPCRECLSCRSLAARELSLRAYGEAKVSDAVWFVTFTYADAHLPLAFRTSDGVEWGTLVKGHLSGAFKRWRFHAEKRGVSIRFFSCGEYGSNGGRPHFHALVFTKGRKAIGWTFDDEERVAISRGHSLFRSRWFESTVWPYGAAWFGRADFGAAAYVSKYALKVGKHVGEAPPFVESSRRPGVGAGFYSQFKSDMYPRGKIMVGEVGSGRRFGEFRTPKFFDLRYRADDVEGYRALRRLRLEEALSVPEHERVRVAEVRLAELERKVASKERDLLVATTSAFEAWVDGSVPAMGPDASIVTPSDLDWRNAVTVSELELSAMVEEVVR